MKQQKTRELLVTTKVAQHWQQEDFEQRVDELMNLVSKVDTEQKVQSSSEMLDVYQNTTHKPKARRKKASTSDRPFEFMVFRN
jgi:predicted nucleic acid-binding Zn ribbon protein